MLLKGSDLAGFIKERQFRQVKNWRGQGITPHLAIVRGGEDEASDKYLQVKQEYGQDIGAEVTLHTIENNPKQLVEKLNQDPKVYGVIVQLPLPDQFKAKQVLNLVGPGKDVDGLAENTAYRQPTPTAILWLLDNYNISLNGQNIAVVGQGRLVGAPLTKILENANYQVAGYDEHTKDLADKTRRAGVVISAAGQPGLITEDFISPETVIIDAGTSNESGQLVGDVDSRLYERDDLKIAPVPGGVGPLTVCALFDNLLAAVNRQVDSEQLTDNS